MTRDSAVMPTYNLCDGCRFFHVGGGGTPLCSLLNVGNLPCRFEMRPRIARWGLCDRCEFFHVGGSGTPVCTLNALCVRR